MGIVFIIVWGVISVGLAWIFIKDLFDNRGR